MSPDITLRPIDSEDDEFLFRLFRSAHEDKFASLGLPEEQLTPLLRSQYEAQETQYRGRYEESDLNIVLSAGVPVGRYYVRRGEDEIVLIDITILPEHRANGIGGALVSDLLHEGKRAGKPVRAHVERMNRAQNLWLRLGFQIVEDLGVYFRLEQPVESRTETTHHEAAGADAVQGAVCD